MARYFLVLLCIYFIKHPRSSAQTLYRMHDFEQISVKDGLSHNTVTDLYFDSLQYLWISTLYGINRFDGRSMEVFTHRTNPDLLPVNYVEKFVHLSSRQLGVASRSGFSVVDPATLLVTPYIIPDTSKLKGIKNSPYDATRLTPDLLAITTNTGFYILNKDGRMHFEYSDYVPAQIGTERMIFGQDIFTAGPEDWLIYVRSAELYHYSLSKNKFTKLNPQNPGPWGDFWIKDRGAWSIKKQWSSYQYAYINFYNGEFTWLDTEKKLKTVTQLPPAMMSEFYWDSYICPFSATTFGVNRLNYGFYHFTVDTLTGQVTYNPVIQMPELRCFKMVIGPLGKLWIASDQGVFYEKKKDSPIRASKISLTHNPNENLFFTDVLPLEQQILLSTGNNSSGVIVLDKLEHKILREINFASTPSPINEVDGLVKIDDQTVWCTTSAGIVALNTKNWTYRSINDELKIVPNYYAFSRQPVNDMVMINSPFYDHLREYNVKTQAFTLLSGEILQRKQLKPHIYTVDNRLVWFWGDGLLLWDRAQGTFTTQFSHLDGTIERIFCVSGDGQPSWWLTGENTGLIEYNSVRDTIVEHNAEHLDVYGYPSALSPVVDDQIWVWQNKRLLNYNLRTAAFTVFGEKDNIPDEETDGRYIRFSPTDSTFYFVTNKHLITTRTLKQPEIYANPIIISSLLFPDGSSIHHPGDTIHLEARQNSFQVKFTNHDFENKTSFLSYTIDGITWYNSPAFNINLPKLPTGIHHLQVQLKGNSVFSNISMFTIYIRPHFYQNIYFKTGLFLLTVALIYALYRFRLNRIHAKADLNLKLAEQEMAALHAQMNPHFLFNCLNAIKNLILQGKVQEASRYLSLFSVLIRANLEHSRRNFISVQEELDYISKYLEMEKLRFAELQIQMQVDETINTEQTELPAMVIQPLVENAIWHGFQSKPGDKIIKLFTLVKGQRIHIIIDDNGMGLAHSSSKTHNEHMSLALENIRKRLDLLNTKYKSDFRLELIDKSTVNKGSGTQAILTFTNNQ